MPADSAESLGQLVSIVRPDGRLGLLIAGLGVLAAIPGVLLHGSALVYVGAMLLCFGVLVLLSAHTSPVVSIYSGGITNERRGRVERCPWNQVKLLRITEVRYSAGAIPHDREVRAELVRGDGRKFVLAGVARAFAETIEHEVYSLLLPKARSALASGGIVQFGDLALAPNGVSQSGNVTLWCDIKDISIELGDTVVVSRRNQRSIRVRGKNTGNLPLLFLLAKERMGMVGAIQ